MPETIRVAAFIDWQNTYGWARRAFEPDGAFHTGGQVHPRELATLLMCKGPGQRELTYLGVYTGRPDPRKDPHTHGAHMRQCQSWEATCGPELAIRARALRYPGRWPQVKAEEKGIDVQLAIDAMVMGVQNRYDVALLVSADTDLLPVVEGLLAMKDLSGHPHGVEVVGWGGVNQKLTHPDAPARWIGLGDYRTIQDDTDYNVVSSGRSRRRAE